MNSGGSSNQGGNYDFTILWKKCDLQTDWLTNPFESGLKASDSNIFFIGYHSKYIFLFRLADGNGNLYPENSDDNDKLIRNSKQIVEVYPNTTIKSARARNIGQKVLKGIKSHGNFQITIIMTKNRLLRLKGKEHQKFFWDFQVCKSSIRKKHTPFYRIKKACLKLNT